MTKTVPWTLMYAPKTSAEIVGQSVAVQKLRAYIANYRPGQKPMLLVGKSGVGKTTSVYAVAQELDKELLEINASDVRNKGAIESVVGAASKQASLFFRGKIILMDEVDGVSGTQDRGGIGALIGLFEGSRYPIVCTANGADEEKIKALRKECEVVEMTRPSPDDVASLLRNIANAQKIEITDEDTLAIAHRSGGDVRAAITDLQIAGTGERITKADVQMLSERDSRHAIEQALLRIFKTTSADIALPALDSVDMDVDELLLWMQENIPHEYTKPEDRARALAALADADRFFGRIRRWQYYRFYVYIYNLLTAGVALAKDAKYPGTKSYVRSERLLKIWISNQRHAKRKKFSGAIAPHMHVSAKQAFQEAPFLRLTYQKSGKEWQKEFSERYKLDDEASEWLEK